MIPGTDYFGTTVFLAMKSRFLKKIRLRVLGQLVNKLYPPDYKKPVMTKALLKASLSEEQAMTCVKASYCVKKESKFLKGDRDTAHH